MLFSGKENVFMCLAVTKFILRKINFGVWFIQTFLQKMHQIRQEKQYARPTSVRRAARLTIVIALLVERLRRSSDAHARRSRCSSARCDRRTSGVDRATRRRSAIWALSLWSGLSLLSHPLSLSFSGNDLKWKWGEKIISGSKVKILVNRKSFSVTAKHVDFTENDFWKRFSPNSNTTLI